LPGINTNNLLGAAGVAYGGPAGRVDGLGEVGVGEDDARVRRADAAQVHLADAVHLALEEDEAAVVLLLPYLRSDGAADLRPLVRLHKDLRALEHGLPVAEDEVDVALDVAALVVVAPGAVEEGVVGAVERAVVEGHLVAGHHRRHRPDLRVVHQTGAGAVLSSSFASDGSCVSAPLLPF